MNGAIAGALIGTVGLAAEWAWSHIWMPIPWNDSLLPEAAIAGILTAVASGVVGGFIGAVARRPERRADQPRGRTPARERPTAAPRSSAGSR